MESSNRNQISWRFYSLLIILIILAPLNLIFNNVNTPSSVLFHSLIEILSTSLALFINILALVRYYSKKDDIILFIGTGFLGTAFFEAFHGISAHITLTASSVDEIIIQFPWSWLAPRYFLSAFLLLSYVAWRYQKKLFKSELEKEKNYLAISIFLTIATFLFFTYAPIMPELYSLSGLARPLEIIPAILFAVALLGYYYKGHWKTNTFEYCLVLSLLLNFICQFFYMPFSDELFDLTANMGHYLKILSYMAVIVGLLINLHQIYQQAEAANRTKSDFLNIMSQELRNPLTIILGYTPLLKTPEKMPKVKALINALDNKEITKADFTIKLEGALAELSKYTLKMDAAGKNLLALINDMLDLSKIEAGMMTARGAQIDLDQATNKICSPYLNDASKKGLTLNIRKSNYTIFAEEEKFTKIISILIDNAIKYSNSGLIQISSDQLRNMIEISISDTGIGIEPTALNIMIDHFSKPTVGSNTFAGDMGLSLALCQALVELHGGNISVISELNRGTTFTITLPVPPE